MIQLCCLRLQECISLCRFCRGKGIRMGRGLLMCRSALERAILKMLETKFITLSSRCLGIGRLEIIGKRKRLNGAMNFLLRKNGLGFQKRNLRLAVLSEKNRWEERY